MTSCQIASTLNQITTTALMVGVVGLMVLGLTLIVNLLIRGGGGGALEMNPTG